VETFGIVWRPRVVPLEPVVAVADGEVARAAVKGLLERRDLGAAQLVVTGAPGLFCVAGPSDNLPWVDGIRYFGVDERAPHLRLPTREVTSVHPGVLQNAILRAYPDAGSPMVVDNMNSRVLSLAPAKPVRAEMLARWLEVESA